MLKKTFIFSLIGLFLIAIVSAGIFSGNTLKDKNDLIQTGEDTFIVPNKNTDIEIKKTDYANKNKELAKEKLKQDILKYGCADFWFNEEKQMEIRFHEGGAICRSPCYWAERMLDENMITNDEVNKICKKE